MSTRDRLTLAAAVAVLMACAALVPVFAGLGWIVPVAGAVLTVGGVCAGARSLGVPHALQPLPGLLARAPTANRVSPPRASIRSRSIVERLKGLTCGGKIELALPQFG